MLLLKGILFLMSNMGYWIYFRKKLGINTYFLPVITIALQCCILLLSGLLYILPEAAMAIYFLGLCLFGYTLYKDKKYMYGQAWCNWGYLFLFFGLVSVYFFLKDHILHGGDDFNHWGTVVKKIIETDRIPNFKDAVIEFQHYPLGSAIYIYYFCKMIGSADNLQMYAQSVIMLASILPLFAFSKNQKRDGILCLFLSVMSNMLLGYNVSIVGLLVDTLLPLVGMAAIAYVIYINEKDWETAKQKTNAVWLLIPLVIYVAQIKNAGILFSFFAAAVMVLYLFKDRTGMLQKLVVCASPLFGFFLWDRHCTNSFPWAAQTKHAMTAMNYIRTFSEKSTDSIAQIGLGAIRYAFTRDNIVWILVWLAVLACLTFLVQRERMRSFCSLVAGVSAMYVVYSVGVAGMFLFSMPIQEAMELASIERYLKTIDIASYYLLILYGVILISGITEKKAASLVGTGLILLGVINCVNTVDTKNDFFTVEHRLLLENNIRKYCIPEGTDCFICLPFDDGDYYRHLCGYLLDKWPMTKQITETSQLEEAKKYDVLINLDEDNEIVQTWIAQNYPEFANETVVFFPG